LSQVPRHRHARARFRARLRLRRLGNRKTTTTNGRISQYTAQRRLNNIRSAWYPAGRVLPAAPTPPRQSRQRATRGGRARRFSRLPASNAAASHRSRGLTERAPRRVRLVYVNRWRDTARHSCRSPGNLTLRRRRQSHQQQTVVVYTWTPRTASSPAKPSLRGDRGSAPPRQKLTFAYDSAGRRNPKKSTRGLTRRAPLPYASVTPARLRRWNLRADIKPDGPWHTVPAV